MKCFENDIEMLYDANDICTGKIILNTTDNVPGKDKAAIFKREVEKLGIPTGRTVMVGDGWGDVAAMKLAARAYCVGDNFPEVREASEWIGHSLLPLLGVGKGFCWGKVRNSIGGS